MPNSEVNDISFRFKNIRISLGFTQQEFGIKLGNISKTSICSIEIGRRGLSHDMRNRLYTTFQVNPDYLDNGQEPMFLSTENDINLPEMVDNLLKHSPKYSKLIFLKMLLSASEETCDQFYELLNKLQSSCANASDISNILQLLVQENK